MRLIDADAIEYEVILDSMGNGMYSHANHVYEGVIDAMPTVDAVPVIRCKDCRHYTGKWCTIYSTKQFDINDIYKDDDDFCSQADGREE